MSLGIGFQSFLLSVIILLIIFGNGLVIASVVSCRRLRSVTNLFTVSLALADLALAFLVLPLSVVYMALPPELGWPFGWTLCRFWMSCDVTCCTASIMHLCLISLDRYIAITDPLRYKSRMSKRNASVVIACAWCISMAISFVPIFLDWFSDKKDVAWAKITTPSSIYEPRSTIFQYVLHNQTSPNPSAEAETEIHSGIFNSTIEILEEYLNRSSNNNNSQGFLNSTQHFYSISTEFNVPKSEVPFCAIKPNKIYAVITSCTSFFLPLTGMIIFYSRIYQIAERQRTEIRNQSVTPSQARIGSSNRIFQRKAMPLSSIPALMADMWKKTSTVHCNVEASSADSMNTEHYDDNRDTMSTYLQTSRRLSKQVNSIYERDISVLSQEDESKFSTQISSKYDRDLVPDVSGRDSRLSASLSDFSKSYLRQDATKKQQSIIRETLSQQNLQGLRVQNFYQNGLKDRVASTNLNCRLRDRASNCTISSQPNNMVKPAHYLKQQNDHKAIRTLGVLMGLFCTCWLPFFIMYLLLPFCQLEVCLNSPRWLEDALTWLGYCNSLFNPCVYALMNRDFKEAYWKLIRMRRCSL